MANKSAFDYKQFAKYIEALGIAKPDFRIRLIIFLLKETQRVVSIDKSLIPVDTKYLRNSRYIGSQKISQTEQKAKSTSKRGKTKMKIDIANSDVLV